MIESEQNLAEPKVLFSRTDIYKMLFYIGIMIVINFTISRFLSGEGSRGLDGRPATQTEFRSAATMSLTIGFAIIGFLIGALISFIPYKGGSYRQKYLYFSLASILALQIFAFFLPIAGKIFRALQ